MGASVESPGHESRRVYEEEPVSEVSRKQGTLEKTEPERLAKPTPRLRRSSLLVFSRPIPHTSAGWKCRVPGCGKKGATRTSTGGAQGSPRHTRREATVDATPAKSGAIQKPKHARRYAFAGIVVTVHLLTDADKQKQSPVRLDLSTDDTDHKVSSVLRALDSASPHKTRDLLLHAEQDVD